MRSYLKSELAKLAGVSYSTFFRFLQSRCKELDAMGVNPNAHIMRGDVLDYVCREYNIQLPQEKPETKKHIKFR
jgi:hypothetical protein